MSRLSVRTCKSSKHVYFFIFEDWRKVCACGGVGDGGGCVCHIKRGERGPGETDNVSRAHEQI